MKQLVSYAAWLRSLTRRAEYKEAFALFDKKGTGAVPRETLGDLLRALGQNPTQAEVADIVNAAPREGTILISLPSCIYIDLLEVVSGDYQWTIGLF